MRVIAFINQDGVNSQYPVEIMALGYNENNDKRDYYVYYSAKREFTKDKIKVKIGKAGWSFGISTLQVRIMQIQEEKNRFL